RCCHCQRNAVDEGVRNPDEFNVERTNPELLPRKNGMKFDFVEETEFLKLSLNQAKCEASPVYRRIDNVGEKWEVTAVIFVPMSEDDRFDFVPVVLDIGKIRNGDVGA